MKLEEARILATPGPLLVAKDNGKLHGAIATTLVADGVWVASLGNTVCPQVAETAALLAHCFNHFDEVVKALSRCLYALEAIKDDPTIEPFFTEGVEVLAKAKVVKI
jgi:hypothetical protein